MYTMAKECKQLASKTSGSGKKTERMNALSNRTVHPGRASQRTLYPHDNAAPEFKVNTPYRKISALVHVSRGRDTPKQAFSKTPPTKQPRRLEAAALPAVRNGTLICRSAEKSLRLFFSLGVHQSKVKHMGLERHSIACWRQARSLGATRSPKPIVACYL